MTRAASCFRSALLFCTLAATLASGCAPTSSGDELGSDESAEDLESSLSAATRRDRVSRVRDLAAKRGITNSVLVAGVANAETGLSQCWSELSWACKGPYSADCAGPVVAGSGDGPCSWREGGLGIFQFDAGTFEDTLAREGTRVLSVNGNIEAGLDFIIEMVRDSDYIGGVTTDAQAVAWINGATLGTSRYDAWLRTVVRHYNGCVPGACDVFWSRYDSYDSATRELWSELGAAFFTATDADPIELDWSNPAAGTYELRAIAPLRAVTVDYVIDGVTLRTEVKKDNPSTATVEKNYPARITELRDGIGRRLEVLGRDANGAIVGRGIGSVDVSASTGVAIRQVGERTFEIGVERAPSDVAAIEVLVDGQYLLVDEVTSRSRSTRKAVRYTFSSLGSRKFAVTTFGSNGVARGTLTRTFSLD